MAASIAMLSIIARLPACSLTLVGVIPWNSTVVPVSATSIMVTFRSWPGAARSPTSREKDTDPTR